MTKPKFNNWGRGYQGHLTSMNGIVKWLHSYRPDKFGTKKKVLLKKSKI